MDKLNLAFLFSLRDREGKTLYLRGYGVDIYEDKSIEMIILMKTKKDGTQVKGCKVYTLTTRYSYEQNIVHHISSIELRKALSFIDESIDWNYFD